MFLRSDCRDIKFPEQVTARPAGSSDLEELRSYLSEYCEVFSYDIEYIMSGQFTVVTPDSSNPYVQMCVPN